MHQLLMRSFIGLLAIFSLLGAAPQDPPRHIELPAVPTYSLPNTEVSGMTLKDVNGDGFPDLFCSGSEGGRDTTSVMYLSVKGRFEKTSWRSANAMCAEAVVVTDLDGDGDEDMFLVGYNHSPASAYRNEGKGRFSGTPFWKSEDTESSGHALAGDFDGDGHQDVMVDDRIYRGLKDGLAEKSDWRLEGDHAITGMLLADVDGDGRKDLVITDWNGGPAYSVFRGLKKDFEKTPSLQSNRRGEFSDLAVGDIDGDGFPEVFVGASTFRGGDGRVRMYANARGKLSPDPSWWTDDVDCNSHDVELADFDKDGDLDLLVLAGDHSAIYENRKGTLATQPLWRATLEGGNPLIVDLDNDGRLDLILAGRKGIHVYMGAGGLTGGKPAKVDAFPEVPHLPPLTRRDLLPDADPEMEKLLVEYRKSKAPELLAKLKEKAPAAMTAIEILDDAELRALASELGPLADKAVASLVDKLSADTLADREEAVTRLTACGSYALPALTKAGASDDPERALRARIVMDQIAVNSRGPQPVDVLGMKLARLTERLKRRYGYQDVEGVVVLNVAEHVGPGLGLANLREGDLLVGIGPLGEYGRKVDPVTSPIELPGLILKQDDYDKDPDCKDDPAGDRTWRLAGYRYLCGPLHPTQKGKTRQWRMSFSLEQWAALKHASMHARPWLPEK